eukprot:gene19949-23868_t
MDAVCMACARCEGCFPDVEWVPWHLPPAEPTCGHCPCEQECAPGCTAAMQYNTVCDPECFALECNYDNFKCAWPESTEQPPQTCGGSTNTQIVRAFNPASAYTSDSSNDLVQLCCEPEKFDTSVVNLSETVTLLFFPDDEPSVFGFNNAHDQDSFQMWRSINTHNRILGGLVIQTFRNYFVQCGDDFFRDISGYCLSDSESSAW